MFRPRKKNVILLLSSVCCSESPKTCPWLLTLLKGSHYGRIAQYDGDESVIMSAKERVTRLFAPSLPVTSCSCYCG